MSSQSHMNQGPEDEREQEARRIVQISAVQSHLADVHNIYMLDNRGDIHVTTNSHYEGCFGMERLKLPPLPQDD